MTSKKYYGRTYTNVKYLDKDESSFCLTFKYRKNAQSDCFLPTIKQGRAFGLIWGKNEHLVGHNFVFMDRSNLKQYAETI